MKIALILYLLLCALALVGIIIAVLTDHSGFPPISPEARLKSWYYTTIESLKEWWRNL